ncbi:MAG: hypothetical protein JWM72_2141 [Actinomycetia bacterium]|nr:hypothetical protein [Actinomycetes bacterium]
MSRSLSAYSIVGVRSALLVVAPELLGLPIVLNFAWSDAASVQFEQEGRLTQALGAALHLERCVSVLDGEAGCFPRLESADEIRCGTDAQLLE